jgi:hypothetical protein
MSTPGDEITQLKEMFKRCMLLAEQSAESARIATEAAKAAASNSATGEQDFGISMNDSFDILPPPTASAATNPFDFADASNLFGTTVVEVKRRGRPPKTGN